ncbi:DNA adenine methylase [Altericroceibacterium spongiae]|uniref:site-specific DNA-methyltransferase (adenine-specific) n=1 Tax=Altericroceibacterium spongiae TaxID=2320269 RepID=A0A420ERT3_9SPHN|nr:DNA adenine methylase [Altericroceibacterium spongiae]RKF23395.1 DNA adenine methylase [Altericroceibacterium spongiae]
MLSNPQPHFQAVSPCRPPAAYIGGKRNLAKRLCSLIENTPHKAYAEVFVGMGGIFFRRRSRPTVEVINDWSEDVSTLFRVLQRHYVAFMDMLRFQITSRTGFEKLIALDPAGLTDLERSARFLYLQRTAFGGKVRGRNFGVSPENAARFDVMKLGPMLEDVHERLASVTVERLPWSEFIDRYDRAGTLFYLDPPYFGNEGDYGAGMFARDQFECMAEQLKGIKGQFFLSLNDHPEVRRIFSGFRFREEDVRWTVGGNSNAKVAKEVIISNTGSG